jgi:dynactin complex subunit
MKKLKLGKTSLVLLSTGIFIVAAASLGLSHSKQIKEQSQLDDALSVAEMRLDKLQVTALRQQQAELQKQLDESTLQLVTAKDNLRRSLESANVTDEFFAIAQSCSVTIESINSSGIKSEKLEGIVCSATTLNAVVSGEVPDIVNFVIKLNHDFTTGVVTSAQISIPESDSENKPSANIGMVVRAYEGD